MNRTEFIELKLSDTELTTEFKEYNVW